MYVYGGRGRGCFRVERGGACDLVSVAEGMCERQPQGDGVVCLVMDIFTNHLHEEEKVKRKLHI